MKYSKSLNKASILGARYTIYIRSLIDSNFDFKCDNFPIWDDNYRQTLFNKILEHYMFCEIGFETPELFTHYLEVALNEIMPYYNQLYLTTLYKLDPFLEFKHDEESTRITDTDNKLDTTTNNKIDTSQHDEATAKQTNNTKSTIDDTQTSNGKSVTSDTPQNLLTSGSIEGNKWATQANMNTVSTTGKNTANTDSISDSENKNDTTIGTTNNTLFESKNAIDTTDDYVRSLSGFNSHPALNIEKIRSTLINIDLQIITHEEIKTCFMGVY